MSGDKILIGLGILLLPGVILLLFGILAITLKGKDKCKNPFLKIIKALLIVWAAIAVSLILLIIFFNSVEWFLQSLFNGKIFHLIQAMILFIGLLLFLLFFLAHILLACNTYKKKFRIPAMIVAGLSMLIGISAIRDNGINSDSLYYICMGALLGLAGALPFITRKEDMDMDMDIDTEIRPKGIAIAVLMVLLTILSFSSSL